MLGQAHHFQVMEGQPERILFLRTWIGINGLGSLPKDPTRVEFITHLIGEDGKILALVRSVISCVILWIHLLKHWNSPHRRA